MPRRAKTALETKAFALPIVRPKLVAPGDLTEEQQQDYLRIAALLADDIPVEDVADLVTQLARHVSYARQLGEELARMRTASLRAKMLTRMTELLKLHERQSMRIAVLMQKLRLNPQVREQSWEADRRRLKTPAPAFKPWQAEALDLEAIELQPDATSERKN